LAKPMSLENFMSSHSSKNGAGFIETARLIAGENPARWLVKHLRDWSPCVMLDGNVHARQPGKAEARGRLKKLINAIETIDREIRDAVVLELLLAREFGPLPTSTSMDAVLREIHRRAELASSRLNLLATGLDERLEQLSDCAKLVARELQDSAVSEFLQAEQRGSPPENVEFGTALIEIKRQAESALLSDYLATKAGKRKLVAVVPCPQTQVHRGPFVRPLSLKPGPTSTMETIPAPLTLTWPPPPRNTGVCVGVPLTLGSWTRQTKRRSQLGDLIF
jgi:hypothetical protein